MSLNRMDKENEIYASITDYHYLALKKKEVISFLGAWMNLEDMVLGIINQSQKDKHQAV